MQTISKLLCYIIAVLKRAAIILIKRGLIYEEQKSFGHRLVRSKLSRVYTKDAYLLVRARKVRLPFFCQRP